MEDYQKLVCMLWDVSDEIAEKGMGNVELAEVLGNAANELSKAYSLYNDSTFQFNHRNDK